MAGSPNDLVPVDAASYLEDTSNKEALRSAIAQEEEQMRDLNAQFADLQKAMHALQLKRSDVERSLSYKKNLVAPIHSIPDEVLGTIFELCLPECPVGLRTSDPPLLLLSVCRRWQRTAESQAALWTNIFLVDSTVEAIPVWIARSGALPLSITIRLTDFFARPDNDELTVTLRIIHDQLHRCSSLITHFPEPTPLQMLFPSDQTTQLPLLKTLELNVGAAVEVFSILGSVHAPRLETFSIPDPSALTVDFGISYKLLSSLVVHMLLDTPPVSMDRLATAVASCANLIELDLRFTDEGPYMSDAFTALLPIHIARLRALRLAFFWNLFNPEHFLAKLSMPALEHLTIVNYDEREVRSHPFGVVFGDVVAQWAERDCIPPLKSLVFERIDVGAEFSQPLFDAVVGLARLEMRRCHGVGDVLHYAESVPTALPRLQSLSIVESYTPASNVAVFLRNRLLPERPVWGSAEGAPVACALLTELRLSACPGLQEDLLDKLKAVAAASGGLFAWDLETALNPVHPSRFEGYF